MSNIDSIQTRNAELTDVTGMMFCHIAAFPGRPMTEMGPRWLRGLYSYYIQHNEGISIVAVDGAGKVLGLAVGGKSGIRDEFLHRALFRYPHLLFWKFLTAGNVRRKMLTELSSKLHIGRRTSTSPVSALQTTKATCCGSLLSIAVLPQYQGTGIAGWLIEFFQKVSIERNYNILRLSVLPNNHRAIAFYKKHGWYEIGRDETCINFLLDLSGK